MLIFLTVIFSIFVAGAEVDIAIPSFPEIRSFFNISPFLVEFVLGINLISHCIAALFCGNLGDKYGKKRVINYGFFLFIIGSFICATAHNFTILLFGRIIQGMGVAPAMVLSFIIAIERHEAKDQEKIMGMLNGVATLSICIAPSLGSYVNLYFGWRGNFWLLFILGILALIAFAIFIPSDKKNDKKIKINLYEYVHLLRNKLVALYVVVLCLTIGAYYTFVGIAPILFIESLGVSLQYFGLYLGAMTLTFGIFSIISGRVIKILGKKISILGSVLMIVLFLIASLCMIIFGVQSPAIIILVMLLLSVGFVIPCNIMFVLALETIPAAKGRISALISTTKWIFASIGIQAASYFYSHSYSSVGIIVTFMVFLSFILSAFIWKEDKRFRKACLYN